MAPEARLTRACDCIFFQGGREGRRIGTAFMRWGSVPHGFYMLDVHVFHATRGDWSTESMLIELVLTIVGGAVIGAIVAAAMND